MSKQCSTYI